METHELTFEFHKETKTTVRFSEVVADGGTPIVGELYVKKTALKVIPKMIQMTIGELAVVQEMIMHTLLLNLFLFLPLVNIQQPAGNEPVWLRMPTNTVEQRAAREVARKNWAKEKRMRDAMAATAMRKQRLNYLQQQQRYQSYYYRPSYYRMRPIYINTPTGRVVYWVPY